jgi:hypothetical protein
MKKKSHGGKRPGAGRPKGSGQGRQITSRTISMGKESWDLLERLRGTLPRGRLIEDLLVAAKSKTRAKNDQRGGKAESNRPL